MYIYNFNDSMNVPMLNVDMATSAQVAAVPTPAPSTTSTTNLTVGSVTGAAATPLTPEILNSVMAMTNPLEYSFPAANAASAANQSHANKVSQSTDSHSSSSGSPFDSPMATTPVAVPIIKEASTPTVQQTCSQLIKTSLKLSLEMKRKMSTSDSSSVDTSICKKIKPDLDTSDDEIIIKPTRSMTCLSPEDEDRRRRRRERNKIAATKCRMKKRERTVNLVSEAETLEAQNIDLKAQMRSLELERRSLTEMLQLHANSCPHSDGIQIPNISGAIAKFLNEMGLGNGQSIDSTGEALITVKTEPITKTRNSSKSGGVAQRQQKIPSVNTLRFSTRRSQQSNNNNNNNNSKLIQTTTGIISPVTVTTAAAVANRNCMIGAMTTVSPIQDCKPLPSIDMGFCEGRNESLTPTSSYCKSLISSSSDCYAMSSPDSGFIKSPVDMANYPTLPSILKSDYIPNCDAGLLNDGTNSDRSMEFILKSELVDANDSPYTTVQSADRFLFDGVPETFDPDLDGTTPNSNHPSLIDAQGHMHDGLKEHLLLQGMNNNNNSSHINNNHHHQHQHQHHHHNHHQQQQQQAAQQPNLDANAASSPMMHDFGAVGNLPVITSVLPTAHSTSIIEFNTSCQQFIDASLLKGDFLSQNCEFLDSQFTTDLDSGVTTYTNSSGCLA